METGSFLEAIRGDLLAVSAGDEAVTATAERLSRALESSLQLRLQDMMGQAALELSDQLPAGHVEVRLAGRDLQLVLVAAPEPAPASPTDADDSGTVRLTLRMPDTLKSRVEEAADREGVSTNTWLVHTIARGLDQTGGRRRGGNRITGFAQS